MKLTVLGGAEEVGRSSFLLNIDGLNILVDAGLQFIDQDMEEDSQSVARRYAREALPLIGMVNKLDLIVVTHAHLDHIGALPIVMRDFPQVKTFCTHGTKDLAEIMLRNQTSVIYKHSCVQPYEYCDMESALDSLVGVDFGSEFTVGNSVKIRFIPAGHILGAAMVVIQGEGRTVVFSGNVSSEDQRTMPSFKSEDVNFNTDVFVSESTYGNRVRLSREDEEKKLAQDLKEKLNQGGVVLFPCFALGRWQEVSHFLIDLQQSGQIPNCPIFLDGMGDMVLDVYQKHGVLDTEISGVRNLQRLISENGQDVVETERKYIGSPGPAIIVAPSGSLKGGRSLEYASRIADDPNNGIFFTGFQFDGSTGDALMRTRKNESFTFHLRDRSGNVETKKVVIRCDVNLYPGFSAHADKNGLIDIAVSFGAKQTLLVHGDRKAISELNEELKKKGLKTYIPHNGMTIEF